ncbi:hypothetical protein DCAR_0728148 [Daucus carota subsp. sativus]|uniref:Transposase-associated domain-containing protein n=1 Tax=Daucus carota subsp. sativus TaxID=79200 RepID=A0AAF0XKI1_DAUCS|nr:hypothetical protein DCAR_0728148 [Daucus carota subsp. sativus]
MDRSWMDKPDKLSVEYANGINEFITVAQNCVDSGGKVLCPCCRCVNKESQKLNVIKLHLLTSGFQNTYKIWYYHGEQRDNMEEDDLVAGEDVSGEQDDLATGLNDALKGEYFDIGPTSDFVDDSSFDVSDKYNFLFESLDKPLYDNCKDFSVLSAVVRLMNVKVLNKLTDKAFNDILKCFKEMLPKDNQFPEDYYHTRRLLCQAGLGYEQIDVCQYDCALFYGENANAISCPVCQSSRYVRNKIPHKRLRWFPVKARLKRFFSSKHTSKDMRWHKEVRKTENGILRHPADGMAWKHFDNTYPDFAKDSRSIRMGLASDGFNPFSNLSSTYSLWPVILIPYNMPPWASPNGTNNLMALLIPGPKSPGKDFDVFLQPLIEELKELWDGIDAYDSYTNCMFKLRAVVLWTISDFPAYAYLSGWSTAGKLACPVCLEDTRSRRITDKQCFIGHRCYLDAKHPWRRSKEYDGSTELRGPPRTFTGEDILIQLEEVPTRTTGKAPNNSSRKQKNVCDNIIGTLLDIEGKSKDNLKARKDLQDLNIREELWLRQKTNNKYEKPHASYTLTKEECKSFCQFIRSVRVPDGYASNISRCVTDNNKLKGMKTHDCHVLLQKILPVALLPYLTKNIRGTLIELCQFFQKICAKTIRISDIEELRQGIVIILCKLEKIFPLSFFTIMLHLCVHLPDQVLLGGPVAPRWMFEIERQMGLYKKYVKNMARPDGSIAEAYIVDEAVSFLARYVPNIETRFTRPERNWDLPLPNHHMDVFKSNTRPLGASCIRLLQNWKNAIQCEHRTILLEGGLPYSATEVRQREEFPSWFKKKISQMQVQNSTSINEDLYSLSQGPLERYHSYTSCVVNGVRFRCKEHDDTLKTQCSGVCTEWYNSSPRGRSICMDNNLTSINTSVDWYPNEPFILATQAQQVFYLLDVKRGSNWRFVQRVNHRSIYDIPETYEVVNDLSNNDVFQEEESVHLPSFQPSEDLIESSSLVRRDVTSLSLPRGLVADLFSNDKKQTTCDEDDLDEAEQNELFDDGEIFIDSEEIVSSDHDSETSSENESDA